MRARVTVNAWPRSCTSSLGFRALLLGILAVPGSTIAFALPQMAVCVAVAVLS